MRKSIFLLSMLFVWGSLTLLPAAAADPAVPVAKFPEKAFTFDPVVEGTEVVHAFAIQNTGAAALKIHRVSTG